MSTVDYTVTENGIIQVRTTTTDEDGNKSFHRHTLSPGVDLEGQDEAVVAKANEIWTSEVIAAYEELCE